MADKSQEQAKDDNKNEDDKQNNSEKKQKKNAKHRGPPEKTSDEIRLLEKAFVLDCVAVDSIAKDYAKVQPKMGPAIPPYNSQRDKHANKYYGFKGLDKTLVKTQGKKAGDSIDGPVVDKFNESGPGYKYLTNRNQFGTGHALQTISGHNDGIYPDGEPMGYNGHYGYRRNVPALRLQPSEFGVSSRSPTW